MTIITSIKEIILTNLIKIGIMDIAKLICHVSSKSIEVILKLDPSDSYENNNLL